MTALWTATVILLQVGGYAIPRPQFEAAGIAFALVLLSNALYRIRPERKPEKGRTAPLTARRLTARKLTLAIPALVAAACFMWALWLGPLADDYVLRAWAAAGRFLPADWSYVRPVPLSIWWLLLRVGADWPVLHGLNLACHCATATLLSVLGTRLFNSRLAGGAAGVFFALFPASIEAVGWTAGVFDSLMTLGIVAAAVIFTLSRHNWRSIAALNGLMAAALFTKETAIALPLLLLCLMPLARRVTNVPTRRLALSVLMTGLVAGGYLVVRSSVVATVLMDHLPHTRWQLKDLLVRPYATLVLPFHGDASRFVSSAAALGMVTLFAAAVLPRHDAKPRHDRRQPWDPSRAFLAIVAGLAWTLLSTFPLLGEFYVGPDLQGSRYAYLPLAGFSLALAGAMDASSNDGFRWPGLIGAWAICAPWILAWPLNVASWQTASATRDALLMDAQRLVVEHGCGTLDVQGAPDNVQGAYVFRQGLPVALHELHYAHNGGACIATWKSDNLVVVEPAH